MTRAKRVPWPSTLRAVRTYMNAPTRPEMGFLVHVAANAVGIPPDAFAKAARRLGYQIIDNPA